MSVVIDASIAIAWSLPDERSAMADATLGFIGEEGGVAPIFFKVETANVLEIGMRRGRIDEALRDEIISDLQSLRLDFDLDSQSSAWTTVPALARTHEISAYDATYLDVALRRKLPLATLDRKLRRAATAAGVALFEPAT